MGVVLAGVSGAGKTTAARILARVCGARLVTVDTDRCIGVEDAEQRQACFASVVAGYTLRDCSGCIIDNSLLTVYGYTAALLGLAAAEQLERMVRLESRLHKLVLLLAPVDSLPARTVGKVAPPGVNSTAAAVAQGWMLRLAERLGAMILVNNGVYGFKRLAWLLGCSTPEHTLLASVA